MFSGMKKFRCDDCGNKFRAPGYEYCATALIAPEPCPRCGSRHTYVGMFSRSTYKSIWEAIDKAEKP